MKNILKLAVVAFLLNSCSNDEKISQLESNQIEEKLETRPLVQRAEISFSVRGEVQSLTKVKYIYNGFKLLREEDELTGKTLKKYSYKGNNITLIRKFDGDNMVESQRFSYKNNRVIKDVLTNNKNKEVTVSQYEYNNNGLTINSKTSDLSNKFLYSLSTKYRLDSNGNISNIDISKFDGKNTENSLIQNYSGNGPYKNVTGFDKFIWINKSNPTLIIKKINDNGVSRSSTIFVKNTYNDLKYPTISDVIDGGVLRTSYFYN